jgi:hypothetical protein
MQRLDKTELNLRISNFLQRKLEKFPDLAQESTSPDVIVLDKQPKTRHFRLLSYWGAKPLVR